MRLGNIETAFLLILFVTGSVLLAQENELVCPDKKLNRHSGGNNGQALEMYRHSAIEPTAMSFTSKLGIFR
jgi:hypothetical protein